MARYCTILYSTVAVIVVGMWVPQIRYTYSHYTHSLFRIFISIYICKNVCLHFYFQIFFKCLAAAFAHHSQCLSRKMKIKNCLHHLFFAVVFLTATTFRESVETCLSLSRKSHFSNSTQQRRVHEDCLHFPFVYLWHSAWMWAREKYVCSFSSIYEEEKTRSLCWKVHYFVYHFFFFNPHGVQLFM